MDALLSFLLQERVSALNDAPAREAGEFVLLWLQGQRRIRGNLAFAHAQRRANELARPLVVYEALRNDYPHASERLHHFVLSGVADTARDCAEQGVAYGFFLQTPSSPRGVLHRLAARAAVVVTDYLPTFIHPAQTRALASRARCRVEVVDAAGVSPLSLAPKAEIGARTLRPKVMRRLVELLQPIPEVPAGLRAPRKLDWGFDPFRGSPEEGVAAAGVSRAVQALPGGGRAAGLRRLAGFDLRGYDEARNEPDTSAQSGLSPYLHFGHLGAAEIALAAQAKDAPEADRAAFIEQLIVRRELALNFCTRVRPHDTLAALPPWAQKTLQKHQADPRPALPSDAELETGRSPDRLWNAMQNQLRGEGRIHGWLRMLWGKTILLWSKDAGEALRRMAFLNDKYALDGRDAVSATSFLWCLGLHDRPFPERPVFGVVRSMSLAAAPRKHHLDGYVERWAPKD